MEAYYRTPDYVCSVSFAALDALTQYRNTPVPAENTWEIVGQKSGGSFIGYAALIIVGAVETLVRGLFGLIVYLASLLPIENEKFQRPHWYFRRDAPFVARRILLRQPHPQCSASGKTSAVHK